MTLVLELSIILLMSSFHGTLSSCCSNYTLNSFHFEPPYVSAYYHEGNSFIYYHPLGCWVRNRTEGLVVLLERDDKSGILDGYYRDRSNEINKCFVSALRHQYNIFAVEYGGQCWGGRKDDDYFDIASDKCESDGKGGPNAANVYRIAHNISYHSLGCWRDVANDRAIGDSHTESYDIHKEIHGEVLKSCFMTALTNGFLYFAVQNGGRCQVFQDNSTAYYKHGKHITCKPLGAASSNNVYQIDVYDPPVFVESKNISVSYPGIPVAERKIEDTFTFYGGYLQLLSYEFDIFESDVPPLWFSLIYEQPQLFQEYIIRMREGYMNTSLYYRYDNQRDFVAYTEAGRNKLFAANAKMKEAVYVLAEPFIAFEVRIHVMRSSVKLTNSITFKNLFNTKKSVLYRNANYFVGSTYFEKANGEFLEVLLWQESTITSILYISGYQDPLVRFCVNYTYNNNEYQYKDNPLASSPMFFANIKEIHLKPFVASSVRLSCLVWRTFYRGNFTIQLKGYPSHKSSHKWSASKKYMEILERNNSYVFKDQSGCVPLYGNLSHMNRMFSRDWLRSNYIGSDCFTRPSLCDSGFTVGFDMRDYFFADEIIQSRTPYEIFSMINGNKSPMRIHSKDVTLLYFHHLNLKITDKDKNFYIHFPHVDMKHSINNDIEVTFFFVPSDEPNIESGEFDYKKVLSAYSTSNVTTRKTIEALQKTRQLILLNDIRKLLTNNVNHLSIVIKADDGSAHISYSNVYETELLVVRRDLEKVHAKIPIISAGVNIIGNEIYGTGFTIYYEKGSIGVSVQTTDKVYSLTYVKVAPDSTTTSSYVVTWSTDGNLKLYKNGKNVKQTHSGTEKTSFPLLDEEYIKLFGSSSDNSILFAKFYKFELWRKPLDSANIIEMDKIDDEIEFTANHQPIGKGYTLPMCYREPQLCPVDKNVNEITLASIGVYIRKWEITVNPEGNFVGNCDYHLDHFVEHDTIKDNLGIRFPPTNLDFDNLEIVSAILYLPSVLREKKNTCIWISAMNRFYQMVLDCFNLKKLYDYSIDVKKILLRRIMNFNAVNRSSIMFVSSLSSLSTVAAKLDIKYKQRNGELYAVIHSKNNQTVGIIEVDLDEYVECLSFKFSLVGEGIGHLSIQGCNGFSCHDKDFLRIHASKVGEGAWNNVEVTKNEFYKKIRIAPLRNKLQTGYVAFKDIRMNMGNCDDPITPSTRIENHFGLLILIPFEAYHDVKTKLNIKVHTSHQKVDSGYQTFFQGYDYYHIEDVIYVFHEEFHYKQFTIAGWFQYGHSFFSLEVGSGSFLKMDFSPVSMFTLYGNIDYPVRFRRSYIGHWYHIVIQFDGRVVKVFVDMQLIIIHYGSVISIPVNGLMKFKGMVCFQWYDYLLNKYELEQIQLCPNKHSNQACAETSTCKICNQFTNKLEFPSNVSPLVKDDCTHAFDGHQVDSYFPMDKVNDSKIVDLKNSLNTITVTPSMGILSVGAFGNGLCIKENSTVFLMQNSEACSNEECFTAFWIKYNCEMLTDTVIFRILKFSLVCNPASASVREPLIAVHFKNCNNLFPSVNGLWHHMGIGLRGTTVFIYVNGKKISVVEKLCGVNIGGDSSTSDIYSICLDELMISSTMKMESDILTVYETYISSISDNNMGLDKVKKVLLPYVLNAEIQHSSKHVPDKIIEKERQQYILSVDSPVWISEMKNLTKDINEVAHVEFTGEVFYSAKGGSLFAEFFFYMFKMDNEIMGSLLKIRGANIISLESLAFDGCQKFCGKEKCPIGSTCPKGTIMQCPYNYPYASSTGRKCCRSLAFDECIECALPRCIHFTGEIMGNLYDFMFANRWSAYSYVAVNETFRILNWNEGLGTVTNQPITKLRVVLTSDEERVVYDASDINHIVIDNLNQSKYYHVCFVPMPMRGTVDTFCKIPNTPPPPFVTDCLVDGSDGLSIPKCILRESPKNATSWDGKELTYRIFWKSTIQIPEHQLDDDPNTWNLSSFDTAEFKKSGENTTVFIKVPPPFIEYAIVFQAYHDQTNRIFQAYHDRTEGIMAVHFQDTCPQTDCLATSNITLLEFNETALLVSIHEMLPSKLCGKHLYIIIVAIQYGDVVPDEEELSDISFIVVDEGKNFTSEDGLLKRYEFNISSVNITSGYLRNASLTGLSSYTNYSLLGYLCNQFGCGNASIPTHVQTDEDIPLCSPVNATLQNTSSTSVIATWKDVPRNCSMGVIISYNISFRRTRYNTTIENSTSLYSFEIKDLEKFEYVCIRVAGSTKKGTGPYSDEVCCYTDEDTPYLIPLFSISDVLRESTDFVLIPRNEYSLHGWLRYVEVYVQTIDIYLNIKGTTFPSNVEDMLLSHGNISKYQDNWFAMNHTKFFTENVSFPAQITNLSAFTFYAFQAAYVTRSYIGNYTEMYIVRTLEDVPDLPPKNVSAFGYDATSILVLWDDIIESGRNGLILGYRIFYQNLNIADTTGEMFEDVDDPLQFQFIVRGLQRDSQYNVSIAGYTSVGVGIKSGDVTSPTGEYVDGNYTVWSFWTLCNVSCGGGISYRTRSCTNPVPYNGGYNCTLPDMEIVRCNEETCPGPVMGPLGDFNCDNLCQNIDLDCYRTIKTKNLTEIFTKVGVDCSSTQDERLWSKQYHPCYYPKDNRCAGYVGVAANISCNPNVAVMVDAQRICNCVNLDEIDFSPWADWSPCSQSCYTRTSPSIKTRKRVCYGFCNDKDTHSLNCDVVHCPVNGNWGQWGEMLPCTKSCGFGYHMRYRSCDSPSPLYGGMECPGPSIDAFASCNMNPCPVHGGVGEWTNWTVCEEPCGVSESKRVRYCNNPEPRYRGRFCSEHLNESRWCHLPPCPVVDVDYIIRYTSEKWNYRLFYTNRQQGVALSKKVKENVLAAHTDVENINHIVVEKFRKGSVIAYFTIQYKYLKRDQIVSFFATMTASGKVHNMSISNYSASSSSIPCPPPENISYTVVDKTTVNITWDMQECNITGHRMYLYYMPEREYTLKKKDWIIRGETAQSTSMAIPDLKVAVKYKGYLMQSILGLGNAIPTREFIFQTYIAPPSATPLFVTARSSDPEEIYVEWIGIGEEHWNGELKGYKIHYKKYFDKTFKVKTIPEGYFSSTLTNLKPYTYYLIEVTAFNSAGEGPPEFAVERTLEGVPSIPVPNVVIKSKYSATWWSLTWSAIPDDKANGKLLGYLLTYYLTHRSGVQFIGEAEKKRIELDRYTFYYKVDGVLNYARYSVTIAGYTATGEGPAIEYNANTCNCKEHLYSNWFALSPYSRLSGPYNLTGFFPQFIRNMIVKICGRCKYYKKSILHFFISKTGENTRKIDESELKRSISLHVDVSFLIYGQTDRVNYIDGSLFVVLLQSPGCAIIVRNSKNEAANLEDMIYRVMNVWPFLVVSYAIATAFGLAIWLADEMIQPGEYTKLLTFKGVFVGFWFSFVTMTTMGYGDIVPRSFVAKTLSIIWSLIGLVLNGIIVGFITSELTSIGKAEDFELYNTKTGVIAHSFENQYALRKNAIIDPDVAYRDVASILDALENEEIDIALIEVYTLASHKETMKTKNLKLKKIVDTKSGYGLVLGGLSTALKPDIEGWMLLKSAVINDFVLQFERKLPELEMSVDGESTQDIFVAESYGFFMSTRYLFIIIGILVFFGIVYEIYRCCRRRNKVQPKDAMQLAVEGLRCAVEDFKVSFAEKIDELEKRHLKEIVSLVDKKKEYERRCKIHGKQLVDLQLRISYAEAKKNAAIRAGRTGKNVNFTDIWGKQYESHT